MAAVSALSPDAGPVDTRPPEDDIEGDDEDDVSEVTVTYCLTEQTAKLTRFQLLRCINPPCTGDPFQLMSSLHSLKCTWSSVLCVTQVFFLNNHEHGEVG